MSVRTHIVFKLFLITSYVGENILALGPDNLMILFPTSTNIEWHDVSPSNLICPGASLHQKMDKGLYLPVRRPTIGKTPNLSGTLCIAMELVTTCYKGFFGSVDVTISSNPSVISEDDCRKEIASQSQGDYRSTEHPQPSCSWMRTSSVRRSIITLNPLDVHYDPYSDTLYSSIFLGGKCQTDVCPTVFENRIWIPHESLTEFCSAEKLSESKIILYNSSDTQSSLWSPDFVIPDDKTPCIMDFCGHKGLRFPSGDWVALSRDDIPKEEWVGEYFYHLTDCAPHTVVNVVDSGQDFNYISETLLDEFINEQCELTISKIKEGDLISRIELQTLSPRTPGFHPVYRYQPGTFQMSMTHYSWIVIKPTDVFPYIELFSHSNESIRYDYWTVDNKTGIIDGPNGLYVLNKNLIYGLREEQTFKRILSKSSKQKFPLFNTKISQPLSVIKLLSYSSHSFSNDATLAEVLWHPLLIGMVLTCACGLLVLVMIVYFKRNLVLRKVLSCMKESTKSTDDMSEEEGDYFDP
uniref:Glycoprotein n=1 Tax=Culex pseudovishnui rhabdo-like virus TaxID=2684265 RepID=A0A6F8PYR0_9RHAB|nr:glycoprotein [Culex pseudovishnui rhabdo-like virus]